MHVYVDYLFVCACASPDLILARGSDSLPPALDYEFDAGRWVPVPAPARFGLCSVLFFTVGGLVSGKSVIDSRIYQKISM